MDNIILTQEQLYSGLIKFFMIRVISIKIRSLFLSKCKKKRAYSNSNIEDFEKIKFENLHAGFCVASFCSWA